MDFNVCIVRPEGYIHSLAFLELAELLHFSLRELGHDAKLQYNRVEPARRNIVIGCHLLDPGWITRFPASTIILNTEQIAADDGAWNEHIFPWVRQFEVWDYSSGNISRLEERGIERVRHLRLGFQQELVRIEKAAERDIDVLFYGSVNDRRRRVIERLRQRGLNVQAVFGVYGADRDRLIARSKLVLNLHFYPAQIFEVVRVFYLMTNSVAVVSEISPASSIDPIYLDGICPSSYDELVDSCVRLAGDRDRRSRLEADALKSIAAWPQSRFTSDMLD